MGSIVSKLVSWPLGDELSMDDFCVDVDSLVDDLCLKLQVEETDMAIEMIYMVSDVNKLSRDFGLSPLHLAAESGNIRCVQALLNKHANVNIKDCRLFTPLHLAAAAARASYTCNKMLVDAGADVNARDIWGKSALHRAIIYKQKSAIHLLLDVACDVNVQDNEHRTVLMYLAHYPYWCQEILNKIINSGANVNLVDKNGRSSLYYAVLSRQLHLIKVLVHHGANLEDEKPIKLAISKCYIDCVYALLLQGTKMNLKLIESVVNRLIPSEDFLYRNTMLLKLLLCSYGTQISVKFVRKIIVSLLHQRATIPGHQHLQSVDISWIVPVICMLLATNSIPLTTLKPVLAMFEPYQLLSQVKTNLQHDTVFPLSYSCRTVIRNEMAKNRANLIVAMAELTFLPVILRDFISLHEFAMFNLTMLRK